jgi:hypothetical protein
MGINIIREEIKIIIETLGEQYAVINQQSGKIPQIELDIIMSNIRKLYERLCDLNKLNSEYPKTKKEEIPEVIMETEAGPTENVIIEPVIEQKKTVAEEKKIEISFEEKVVTIEETKIEETPETSRSTVNLEKTKEIIFDIEDVRKEENQGTEITTEKMEPPSAEVKPAKSRKKDGVDLFSLAEKETLADKFKETQKSMNDKIASGKPDKTLADKIGKSTITSLKNAIGINDKFLFINELFKGDIQEYNKTIDKLNSYSMLEECTDYLMNRR